MDKKTMFAMAALVMFIFWIIMAISSGVLTKEIDFGIFKLNALVATIITAPITLIVVVLIFMFTHWGRDIPSFAYGVLTGGFILILMFGPAVGRPAASVSTDRGNYSDGQGGVQIVIPQGGGDYDSDSNSDSGSSSSDDDSGGLAELLFILLVCLWVILMVILSFILANFWIAGAFSLIMIAILFTIWQFQEERSYGLGY